MLLAFGSNGSGQLGLGHEDDVSAPQTCALPPSFEAAAHVRIAAGGNHTLVLARSKPCSPDALSSVMYASGDNSDGRCGNSPRRLNTFRHADLRINNGAPLYDVKLCSATWEASIFVTTKDEIFSCGTGLKGELGLGEEVTQATTPQLIINFPPKDTRIVDLASSMGHTVAVLSNGDVYGWGQGRKGQLGHPAGICWEPRKINGIGFKAVRAVCGKDFVYVIGTPEEGTHTVLGSDKWSVRSTAPDSIAGWKSIGASWGGIYLLLESGKLIGWGRNDHGQLPPANIPLIEYFAAGSEHVLVRTKTGKILAWGWGEHGNCGAPTAAGGDDVADRWNEIEVEGVVMGVGAGCATSWIHVAEP